MAGSGWWVEFGGKYFKMKYNNGRTGLGVSFFSILSENHFFSRNTIQSDKHFFYRKSGFR